MFFVPGHSSFQTMWRCFVVSSCLKQCSRLRNMKILGFSERIEVFSSQPAVLYIPNPLPDEPLGIFSLIWKFGRSFKETILRNKSSLRVGLGKCRSFVLVTNTAFLVFCSFRVGLNKLNILTVLLLSLIELEVTAFYFYRSNTRYKAYFYKVRIFLFFSLIS